MNLRPGKVTLAGIRRGRYKCIAFVLMSMAVVLAGCRTGPFPSIVESAHGIKRVRIARQSLTFRSISYLAGSESDETSTDERTVTLSGALGDTVHVDLLHGCINEEPWNDFLQQVPVLSGVVEHGRIPLDVVVHWAPPDKRVYQEIVRSSNTQIPLEFWFRMDCANVRASVCSAQSTIVHEYVHGLLAVGDGRFKDLKAEERFVSTVEACFRRKFLGCTASQATSSEGLERRMEISHQAALEVIRQSDLSCNDLLGLELE